MGSPLSARLLPLALLLLGAPAASAPPEFRMRPQGELRAARGAPVELRCEVLLRGAAAGCSWLRQAPGPPRPRFLLYVSGSGPRPAPGLGARLSGSREPGGVCALRLHSFGAEDQGHYFCMVLAGPAAHFSPSVHVRLPAEPTPAPTPAPEPTTAAPRSPRPAACRPVPSTTGSPGHARRLDLACDLYIWAPLAGTCAALLLSLVLTLVCHRRNRRRVCRCPRPVARPGGKACPSERYV